MDEREMEKAAAEMLRKIVLTSPYFYSDRGGSNYCLYCDSEKGQDHEPDCVYFEACVLLGIPPII